MDAVTLQAAKLATGVKRGHLANRPTAVGSMRLYYATDDCGGCLHQDIAAGVWRRVHPRGELASVQNTQPSNFTASGALTSVYSMYLDIVTDEPRPVDVILEGRVQVGKTDATDIIRSGTYFARLSLDENGTKIEDAYCYAATAGDEVRVRLVSRRNLVVGTTYTYRAYIGSQTTSISVRTVGGLRLRAVEV